MRWVAFIILAIVTLALQVSLSYHFQIRGLRPDWVLVLVAIYAVCGRGTWILVAAWTLGLILDLHSQDRVGLASLSYLLAAAALMALAKRLPLNSLPGLMVSTLLAGLGLQGLWMLYRGIFGPVSSETVAGMASAGAGAALYSALFVPIGYYVLRPFAAILDLRFPRYSRSSR